MAACDQSQIQAQIQVVVTDHTLWSSINPAHHPGRHISTFEALDRSVEERLERHDVLLLAPDGLQVL